MVHSAINKCALAKNKKTKKKQELKYLISKLNAVTPVCNKNKSIKSSDVVFKAVEYINQLHKKIAEKKGVENLLEIQKNARNKAIQQLMSMKNKTQNVSKVISCLFYL